MAKICPKCGSIVEDNAKFCDECGELLSLTNESTSSQTINMYNTEYMQNSGTNIPISTEKKVLGIVSLICGMFSIVTIGCWFLPEIVAIVCGVLTKDVYGKRTKLGNAGFICGIIGTILLALVMVIALL